MPLKELPPPTQPLIAEPVSTRVARRSGDQMATLLRIGAVPMAIAILLVFLTCLLEAIFALAHVGEDTVATPDPLLGYFHLENQSITFRLEGYSQTSFNSRGLRGKSLALPKAPGTTRVVVLGDSITLGLEVPLEKTFPELLEKQLHAAGHTKTEVLNCGMSGSGTGQQYLLFKDRIEELRPDIIVLAYHDGDADDNVCGGTTPPRPVFAVGGDGRVKVDFQDIDKWLASEQSRFYSSLQWFRRNSRVWSVICRASQDMARDPAGRAIQGLIEKPRALLWSCFMQQLPPGDWHVQEKRRCAVPLVSASPTAALATAPAAVSATAPAAASAIAPAAASATAPAAASATAAPAASATAAPAAPNAAPFAVFDVDRGQQDVNILRGYLEMGRQKSLISAALLKQLNNDCKRLNCRLVVAALPAFNNSPTFYRELKLIEQLAMQEHFAYIDAWRSFPSRPPMTQSPYFFELHFNCAGHQRMSEAVYPRLEEMCRQSGHSR